MEGGSPGNPLGVHQSGVWGAGARGPAKGCGAVVDGVVGNSGGLQ